MQTLIAANWKRHGSLAMADEFANTLDGSTVDVVVCPPAVFVERYATQAQKTECGLQDIGVAESGAHTGEIAGEMAQEVGAEWVIVGHSNGAAINKKATNRLRRTVGGDTR